MSLWIAFMLLPSVFSGRISCTENKLLSYRCGAHFLNNHEHYTSFGGQKAKINEFPWSVLLIYHFEDKDLRCSGVQVSPRHILTAAHCMFKITNTSDFCSTNSRSNGIYQELDKEGWSVYVGSKCRRTELCENAYRVSNIIVHEHFDYCEQVHDLALMELASNVPYSNGTAICMPDKSSLLSKTIKAGGMGLNHARASDVWSTRRALMKPAIEMRRLCLPQVVTYRKIFEIKETNHLETVSINTSICKGDSGGPLFQLNKRGRYVVIGIASSAWPLCRTPSHKRWNRFIDVRPYIDWICKFTGVCPTRVNKGCKKTREYNMVDNEQPGIRKHSHNITNDSFPLFMINVVVFYSVLNSILHAP
ncbi:Suppressor of tumorigenicity 14 protein [Parelaphostrongylus tenuis]|uniref:Suppressor of tumorigenicity 14 protein n=1 Tax=Parelaphostrongylus tenuis TaxID=148309 RepID=A0AAD5N2F8_PARTN|nr:Suppressor of tumorigenicity 14 protein [Parelaphostrongylus tenuis]